MATIRQIAPRIANRAEAGPPRFGFACSLVFPIPEVFDTAGRRRSLARGTSTAPLRPVANKIAICAARSPSDAETRPADCNAARTPSTRAAPSAT